MLTRLRRRIESLERHVPVLTPGVRVSDPAEPSSSVSRKRQRSPWNFGCPAFDRALPEGLDTGAVHEIKGTPSSQTGASAGDWMGGLGFAVRLAVRRFADLPAAAEGPSASPWILWCWPRVLAGEFGVPAAHGFSNLGLDASRLLIVETARPAETLNAIEESLRYPSLGLVIGVLDELGLTPSRRLSLAAAAGAKPCLLVTHPASAPAGATATRWRVAQRPSSPHPFDPRAPGLRRFSVALERCRANPASAGKLPLLLEWHDETHRFGVAAVVAGLASRESRASERSG